jgi:hypothetical protein
MAICVSRSTVQLRNVGRAAARHGARAATSTAQVCLRGDVVPYGRRAPRGFRVRHAGRDLHEHTSDTNISSAARPEGRRPRRGGRVAIAAASTARLRSVEPIMERNCYHLLPVEPAMPAALLLNLHLNSHLGRARVIPKKL